MTSPDECIDGWEGARRGDCGISCVALFDTETHRMHIYQGFGDENGNNDLEACVGHLNEADLLVGFNTLEFDTPALQGASGLDIHPEQYDILHEIWKALGHREKGFKLDDICKRLHLVVKSSNGTFATQLYRTGQFGKLFDYCMNDVHLTRLLANYINTHGFITDAHAHILHLSPPGEEIV